MKGSIDVGADADLALVDPAATTTIRDEDVISKAGWSPFAGRVVHGDVVTTILRGRVIARDGASLDDRLGRFLPGPGAVASA
jgi:dihydroorotase-like cyclic amidohydrolase